MLREFRNETGTHAIEVYYDYTWSIRDIIEMYDSIDVLYNHRRYTLGNIVVNPGEFSNEEEMINWIKEVHDAKTIVPLYAYEHGDITVSTSKFTCPWDSGQVGWIISKNENDDKMCNGLAKDMDMCLNNNIYRIHLVKINKCDFEHEHREIIDSVGGIFDDSDDYTWCLTEGKWHFPDF